MSENEDTKDWRIAREAEGYFELELYDDALDRSRVLLSRHSEGPLWDFAATLQAECLRRQGRWGEGVVAFEEILRQRPDDVSAFVGLGWCHKRGGRLDLAIHAMERLLAIRPTEAIGLFNLACYCSLAGDRERAIDSLSRSIDEDPGYRDLALHEEDLLRIRDEPAFRRLLSRRR
jgi:tetratricopeptide (TPR) repeat protein